MNEAPAVRTKLYVTNFPEDMDQEEMKQLFNQYGDVLECTIMWNQYAFVHFGSYGEAEKAMIAIKGCQYKGCKISVQWSTSSKYQQPKQHNVGTVLKPTPLAVPPAQTQMYSTGGGPSVPTKILERPQHPSKSAESTVEPVEATKLHMNTSPAITNVWTNNSVVAPASLVTPVTATQSWASIMNQTSPLAEIVAPAAAISTSKSLNAVPAYSQPPAATTATAANSTPGQFKISFSEIVRSSANSQQAAPTPSLATLPLVSAVNPVKVANPANKPVAASTSASALPANILTRNQAVKEPKSTTALKQPVTIMTKSNSNTSPINVNKQAIHEVGSVVPSVLTEPASLSPSDAASLTLSPPTAAAESLNSTEDTNLPTLGQELIVLLGK